MLYVRVTTHAHSFRVHVKLCYRIVSYHMFGSLWNLVTTIDDKTATHDGEMPDSDR